MKDAQTFRCPNVDPESDEFKYGMTGHRYRLEDQMVELAEELVDRLQQETIYVELQKAGVPYTVLEVTA